MVVGEEIPGVTVCAVILPHRAPLTLTQIGPPLSPGNILGASILEPFLFPIATLGFCSHDLFPLSLVKTRPEIMGRHKCLERDADLGEGLRVRILQAGVETLPMKRTFARE
jgi:hypothetical protein